MIYILREGSGIFVVIMLPKLGRYQVREIEEVGMPHCGWEDSIRGL